MLYSTDFKEFPLLRKGKVRDVYQLADDKLLIIATDRVSCFDVVLPTPIPDKGKILTKISLFWFDFLKDIVPNHVISTNVNDLPREFAAQKEELDGRFMITRKCKVVPFECVVRGYISGSAWQEYKNSRSVCGIALPAGLKESDKFKDPIFTPATKAEVGHDENVDFNYMAQYIGKPLAEQIKNISIAIYKKAAGFAQEKGIIIADTKFEFGFDQGKLILIDEVLTPDSSRFWPVISYRPGGGQPSFDKQFVRDYLVECRWNKNPPAPALPQAIIDSTMAKYNEALRVLTGARL